MILRILGAVFISYLCGSVPFGLIVARLVKGVDLRQHGSGNIGATNVFRVVGKKWGILVMFLDAAKGYAGLALASALFGFSDVPSSLLFGLSAILGHSFPVWLKFKGGKGVATSLGVFLAIVPGPTLIAFGIWAVMLSVFRVMSLASLSAAGSFPILVIFLERSQIGFRWLFPVSIVLVVFIFYTHRANIRRLVKGEEKRLM